MQEKNRDNKEMVFGIKPVMELITAGKDIDKILVQKEATGEHLGELLKLAREHKLPVNRVPTPALNRVTRKNHQGVIAFVSAISFSSLDNVLETCYSNGESPLILMLDRVTDVRNFGAIARTAECAGVHAIVVPARGGAQINADAVKTSAGALGHIPICRVQYLSATVTYLQNSGLQIVACTEKTNKTVFDVDFSAPTAIVMGSEEDGISSDILAAANEKALIPMTGKVSSLNVSVAAGVIIFEAIRQRALV